MAQQNYFQRQSRTMALCGMMTALSTALLSAGSLIPMASFACPMLAMLCLLPVLCDCGTKYTLLVYAAVSILALLLCTDKELAMFYLCLGWYPAARPRLGRVPRPLRIALKCFLFTLAMAVMYSALIFLFRLEAVAEEFSAYSAPMFVGLLVLGNAAFLMQDELLKRMSVIYRHRRKR